MPFYVSDIDPDTVSENASGGSDSVPFYSILLIARLVLWCSSEYFLWIILVSSCNISTSVIVLVILTV